MAFRAFLAALAFIATVVPPAGAANIFRDNLRVGANTVPTIIVEGDLELGDELLFADAAIGTSEAIVVFHSPGGNLFAGIEIGRAIRLKGFVTLVPDGLSCASACALAWLGGRTRFMAEGTRIGFHAAWEVDGQDQAGSSNVGNALVGAYLDRLGLPVQAIAYIVEAGPTQIRWLTFDDAQQIGIEVRRLSNSSADPKFDWSRQGEWIQIFSRSDADEAIDLARDYAASFSDSTVFRYDNGWYVVVIGPYVGGTAAGLRDRYVASGAIPSDSIVNSGSRFAELVWSGSLVPVAEQWIQIVSRQTREEAVPIAQEYYARLRTEISVYRCDNGWYAVLLGPYSPEIARAQIGQLRASASIPNDSFVSGKATCSDLVWHSG